MSRGISKSLDHLNTQIESILPKTDSHHGFVAIRDASGYTLDLDNMAHTNRLFEILPISMPIDDGQLGISTRKRVTLEVRVFYDTPQDRGYLDRMMIEDTSALINTLKGPNYDSVTTGVVSLVVGAAGVDTVLDSGGEQRALILRIPFDLLYLED